MVGGRDFQDYQPLKTTLEKIIQPDDIIVSGGCPTGADFLAERYAREHKHTIKIYPAEWDKYGRSAGLRRNAQIVADSDEVVAFWDHKSAGTGSTIRLAKKVLKRIKIVSY